MPPERYPAWGRKENMKLRKQNKRLLWDDRMPMRERKRESVHFSREIAQVYVLFVVYEEIYASSLSPSVKASLKRF